MNPTWIVRRRMSDLRHRAVLFAPPALALFLCAASAAAGPGGINLSWDDCGTFGALNKNFACNTNTGSAVMVGSYVPPDDGFGGPAVTLMTGQEMVLDLQTSTSPLPAWWQIRNTGSCRNTSSAVNATFGPNCATYPGGATSPVLVISAYQIGFGGANKARVKLVAAISQSAAHSVSPTLEYYSFNFVVNYAKTVGTGACAGCGDGACIVLNEIKLVQPNDGVHRSYRLQNAKDRQNVTWQGGGGVPCPGATPARAPTWGSVKSLYR